MSTRRHDLEAQLRFLPPEVGGRRTPIGQGYRADFRYLDDPAGTTWMIHPHELITEAGDLLPEDARVMGKVFARMHVLSDHYCVTEHCSRIKVGTQFQVVEGNHVVAEGVVAKLVGLHDA